MITDKLTAIADAIRTKNGETVQYTLDEMAAAIMAIETGGGLPDGIATGTFQCTPTTMRNEVTVEHGLGVIPRCVFVGATANILNFQEIVFAVTYNNSGSTSYSSIFYNGGVVNCTSSKTVDTTSNVYFPTNGGSAFYFLANTYRWFAIA